MSNIKAYGSKVKSWFDAKCNELQNNAVMLRYVGKDITKMICEQYVKLESQVYTINHEIKVFKCEDIMAMCEGGGDDDDDDDKCERECEYSVVLMGSVQYKKNKTYTPYLIDKSLKCYTILMQTSRIYVGNIYYEDGNTLTLRCDNDNYDNNGTHELSKCTQMLFRDVVGIGNSTKNRWYLSIVKSRLLNGETVLFDDKKRKITEDCMKYARENMMGGTVIKLILQFDQIYEYGSSDYNLLPKVRQIRVCGELEKNYFEKNEFVDDEYRILKKYMNLKTLKRRLVIADVTLKDVIPEFVYYIQTPYMDVTFDCACVTIKPSIDDLRNTNVNALNTLCVTIDKDDKEQLSLMNDLIRLNERVCSEYKSTTDKEYTYAKTVYSMNGPYHPYIRVCAYFTQEILCSSWYDQDGNSYTYNEAKWFVRKGTSIRCIYSYKKYEQYVGVKDKVRCYKVGLTPVLHQCQFIKETNDCLLDTDSEGW